MGTHGGRFYHGSILQRHVIGQPHHPVIVHHKEILGSAVGLKGLHAQVFAYVVLPATAGSALAADQLRPRGNLVSGFAHSNRCTNGRDDTGIFVALHHRIKGGRMLSVVRMYLTSTDADAFYIHQDLVRSQPISRGSRNVPELKVLRFNQYDLSHIIYIVLLSGR